EDASVTSGSATLTSLSASFDSNDVGQLVSGTGIPAGTRIQAVGSATQVTLTNNATVSFDGGEFSILGRTITHALNTLAAADQNRWIEGNDIPGGTTITGVGAVGGFDYYDLSQPVNNEATLTDVRIWDESPSPARLVTAGAQAGQYLRATGRINQVYVVDYRD